MILFMKGGSGTREAGDGFARGGGALADHSIFRLSIILFMKGGS
jgi:hypothetical protein